MRRERERGGGAERDMARESRGGREREIGRVQVATRDPAQAGMTGGMTNDAFMVIMVYRHVGSTRWLGEGGNDRGRE